ncbi:MAG: UDP-N-acetylglucosamine 1-carboxyvinyltransferase [Clostridiales bacterium]|nr:UDP-N-acetylglucosamine 1-carboxyvinyltransferase [Clostridiales bacterium]
MPHYLIHPSPRLSGEVEISTSKNAVLPILAASLLTREEVILHRMPQLTDTRHMLEILQVCGAEVQKEGSDVRIRALAIDSPRENPLLRTMRASVLVLGPLAARNGECLLTMPGGCAIGQRPIDLHLKGLQKLGARVELDGGAVSVSGRLKGANIYLDFPSVGATENLVMAAVLAKGVTRIENAAKEPEIADLCCFLTAMGARIAGIGTNNIMIEGVERLHGAEYTPIPDRIEAGTLACACALTDGSVLLSGARSNHMRALLFKLSESGVILQEDAKGLRLRGRARHPMEARTLSYPGFPTDMQAPLMVVATQTHGLSVFLETIFENRFMHVVELSRMGAQIRVEGQLALIQGGKPLNGASVTATDLRAAAALMLAGLIAQGDTRIDDAGGHLMRGYEALEGKLNALGANVQKMGEEAM